ncbi:MAG TPA: hypothetical protein DEF61_00980, partial [Firmicutes bacterium]|nr:hypothetical protein [Bacillota bacterium]
PSFSYGNEPVNPIDPTPTPDSKPEETSNLSFGKIFSIAGIGVASIELVSMVVIIFAALKIKKAK